jgi:hypothetical protein
MMPTRFLLLSLVVLGAGGCAKHGVDAVKEMRALACAGDVAGFFAHVDQKELIRNAVAEAEKKAEASFAKLEPAAQAAARKNFHERVEPAIPPVFSEAFVVWEHDVKQGQAGELCHMSIMGSTEAGDTADVHVGTPAEGHWRVARRGDRWLLVRAGD